MGYVDALKEANDLQNEFVAAADAGEGARALLEKRSARFKRVGEDR
jgi:hypothetical protein